ncbi:hypothetical protein B0H19DRAFT_1365097 [Mycena capillaripes]|nr:hypothetical protein B0H19DRAFT_1365097 [Mycena capillaripes]
MSSEPTPTRRARFSGSSSAADLTTYPPILTASRTRNDAFLENLHITYGTPLGTLGSLGLIAVGIVLIVNPLVLIGFGSLGPIAGTIAAGWQAAIGNVAAGSLFALLQSIGMVHAVTIPVVGVAVAGGGAVVLAKAAGALQPAARWVQNTATTAWQWIKTRWA